MEFKSYFQPIMKWWWMIAAAGLLAAASTFIITSRLPPTYQSHETLMVGQSITDPNPAQSQFYLEQQLAQIYASYGGRDAVRQGTMKALGLSWLPDYRVTVVPNSQLVDILVTDTDPARAQAVAGELARQIILLGPAVAQPRGAAEEQFIQGQLDDMQVQIKDTQAEIDRLRQQLGNLNSARQIADQENQITILENKLNLLETNYTALLGNSAHGAPNSLTVVEPAELPSAPVGPDKLLSVLMSALISLVIASIGAYALEYFDPTFRTVEEVIRTLPYPVLGKIAEIPGDKKALLYVNQAPLSPIADAFRMVKTSLETAGLGDKFKTIQVLSSETGEGKTTISTNLAALFARAGKRVILVDADLRKSWLTNALDLAGKHGLSEILAGQDHLNRVIQPTSQKNLGFVPAGTLSSQADFAFDSKPLAAVLSQMESVSDIVIIDSPPAFISDAASLVHHINKIVYVVSLHRSRRDLAELFKEQSQISDAQVVGMVLNRLPLRSTYYGRYFGKYGSYYRSKSEPQAAEDQNIVSAEER
ncbi:MAG TPA: polysaccharide biosynthesis tyrosine autokinase, partial [Anaerolineaceae bacterium]